MASVATDLRASILLTTPGFRSYAQAMRSRWTADRALREVAKKYGTTLAAAKLAMSYV